MNCGGLKCTFLYFQHGEIILTSNITEAREEKMKTGRIYVLHKMYPGYEEQSNCLAALNKLEALNDALKDPNKVICYVIYSVCLFKVHIFSHWILCVKQLSFGSRRSLSQRSLCRLILMMILTLVKMCR